MTILRQNNKVIRSTSGKVLTDEAIAASDILHIDGDIQLPNRILKDSSNNVRQYTDKAQNITFIPKHYSASSNPVYKYGNGEPYFEFKSDRKGLIAPAVNINYNESFVLELWWKPTDLANSTTQYIFSHCSSANPNEGLFVRILDGGTTFSSNVLTIDPTDTGETLANNNWYHLMYIFDQNSTTKRTYGYLNGKYSGNSGVPTFGDITKELGIGCTPYYNGSYSTNGDIKLVKITKGLGIRKANQSIPEIGTTVFTPQKPFVYYSRYKEENIKGYISSQYLANSEITEPDTITNLKSCINNQHAIALGSPFLRRKLFFPTGSQMFLTDKQFTSFANNGYIDGFRFFDTEGFIGCWYKLESKVDYSRRYFLKLYKEGESTFDFAFYQDSFPLTNNNAWIRFTYLKEALYQQYNNTFSFFEKWIFVAVVNKNQTLYYYINGILIGIEAHNNQNTSRYRLMLVDISGNVNQSLDDIIVSNSAMINPSDIIDRKDFEPPRRGGFDKTIKQY